MAPTIETIAGPAASNPEISNILGLCAHLPRTAVQENHQYDAVEYLQNLEVNLAWGAAHLQHFLLRVQQTKGVTPGGTGPEINPHHGSTLHLTDPAS